ncbi:hypothetical protein [Arthrobacter caoxuetaonis]|uniref:Uncharacterized protein n=1 Tax=Arthrobacter caoxuetaonis TaxID=2886935 RepID=A0A9X1SE85_9MICC|nr:hypothetical protein [Arthrobacter caoxuetaonis]MCC3299396.1 hypothetical protein [Arthrobacter caoxuetaonis]USQ59111.1 hypothetical protein NF551_18570 [Arthrobacter caoxuetaonis]
MSPRTLDSHWQARLDAVVADALNPAVREAHPHMAEMLQAAEKFGLEAPDLFAIAPTEEDDLTVIWQNPVNRATVSWKEDTFEVVVLPGGLNAPMVTPNAEVAAAFVAGLHTRF